MLPVFLTTIVLLLIIVRLCIVFQNQLKFYLTGQEKGFKLDEIRLLWKLAKATDLEEPSSLYFSEKSLSKAISQIINDYRNKGIENLEKNQKFISKLYEYRTKIDIEKENKKGLDSTKYLDQGQRLRLILKGKGVYTSEIVNNGHEIVIKVPVQKGKLIFDGKEWIGKHISVYLWRKSDAGYVFDTYVTNSGVFNGQSVIYLAHTNELERAQKRRSIRSQCQIYAQLYFLDPTSIDFDYIETEKGYKCLLEDISEDGAMIRIGGMGKPNIQIKIQFELQNVLIVMFGIIRSVEFNNNTNQSRLHFECLHVKKEMKNIILNYVYNVLPDDKKEVLEALSQTEEDEKEDNEERNSESKRLITDLPQETKVETQISAEPSPEENVPEIE